MAAVAVAAALLTTFGQPLTAGEPSREGVTRSEVPASVQRIERAAEYSFKVTVEGSDEEVSVEVRELPPAKVSPQIKREKPRHWVADHWFGHRMVPHVLLVACREPEKGSVRLEFSLGSKEGKERETYVMRSAGLTEDVYILSSLGMREQFAKWLAKAVPDSKEVQQLKPDKSVAADGKEVKFTDELKPILAAANAKYNEQRPELMKRFGGSFLFYPRRREREGDWAISRAGDRLIFETRCADRMMYATFRLEFEQDKPGTWNYVRTLALEEFKGE
jgi:hypothetical protein